MNFKEKMTSLVGLLLLFIAVAKTNTPLKVEHPISWLTWTIIGCVAGLVLFVLIYSDLKKRTFLDGNEKMKWQAGMLIFPPLIIVYLFGIAFKPR